MIQTPPIFVTGIQRSGTTMIAKVINSCGVFVGAHAITKKCMFENSNISSLIVKPYMERMGTDPRGQFPLPKIENISIPMNWRSRIESIMEAEGYKKGPWMYKDTKMGLIWPVWNTAFPNAKWIIVRRRTGDVIQSCLKTGYMTAYKDDKGWLEWVEEYEKRFVEMLQAGVNCKIIWPERMMPDHKGYTDLSQLYEVIDWLGLKMNDEALKYIDPLLWDNKKGDTNGKSNSSRSKVHNG
jgi:hypothetical protein